MSDEASVLASEAYVFGFPLVFDLEQCIRFTDDRAWGGWPPIAFNTFGHARSPGRTRGRPSSRSTTTPSTRSPVIDLSVGPAPAHRPGGARPLPRAAVRRRLDEQLRVHRHPRHGRSGGGVPAGPAGAGARPSIPVPSSGSRRPSRSSWAAGRATARRTCPPSTACRMRSACDRCRGRMSRRGPRRASRRPATASTSRSTFFEKLRVWSQAFPPSPTDALALQTYAAIGLTGSAPLQRSSTELQDALRAGYFDGKSALEGAVSTGQGPMVEQLGPGPARLRLQRRRVRVGHDRQPRVEASGRRDPVCDARSGGAFRPLGQPRLRGGLRGRVQRRIRRAAERRSGVLPAPASDTARGRLLVAHHVRPPRLPPRGERARPVFGRRPDEGDRVRRRRRTEHHDEFHPTDRPAGMPRTGCPTPAGPFRPILRMYGPGPGILEGSYELPPIERIG